MNEEEGGGIVVGRTNRIFYSYWMDLDHVMDHNHTFRGEKHKRLSRDSGTYFLLPYLTEEETSIPIKTRTVLSLYNPSKLQAPAPAKLPIRPCCCPDSNISNPNELK